MSNTKNNNNNNNNNTNVSVLSIPIPSVIAPPVCINHFPPLPGTYKMAYALMSYDKDQTSAAASSSHESPDWDRCNDSIESWNVLLAQVKMNHQLKYALSFMSWLTEFGKDGQRFAMTCQVLRSYWNDVLAIDVTTLPRFHEEFKELNGKPLLPSLDPNDSLATITIALLSSNNDNIITNENDDDDDRPASDHVMSQRRHRLYDARAWWDDHMLSLVAYILHITGMSWYLHADDANKKKTDIFSSRTSLDQVTHQINLTPQHLLGRCSFLNASLMNDSQPVRDKWQLIWLHVFGSRVSHVPCRHNHDNTIGCIIGIEKNKYDRDRCPSMDASSYIHSCPDHFHGSDQLVFKCSCCLRRLLLMHSSFNNDTSFLVMSYLIEVKAPSLIFLQKPLLSGEQSNDSVTNHIRPLRLALRTWIRNYVFQYLEYETPSSQLYEKHTISKQICNAQLRGRHLIQWILDETMVHDINQWDREQKHHERLWRSVFRQQIWRVRVTPSSSSTSSTTVATLSSMPPSPLTITTMVNHNETKRQNISEDNEIDEVINGALSFINIRMNYLRYSTRAFPQAQLVSLLSLWKTWMTPSQLLTILQPLLHHHNHYAIVQNFALSLQSIIEPLLQVKT
jgi:hypothetical protein